MFLGKLLFDGSKVEGGHLGLRRNIKSSDHPIKPVVKENLEKTMAANNVAAVVFDFRGYDTLGESFILLTAIAGSFVILSRGHKKEEKGGEA